MNLVTKLPNVCATLVIFSSLGACSGGGDGESQQAPDTVDQSAKKEILSIIMGHSFRCDGSDSHFWTVRGRVTTWGDAEVFQYEVKNLDFVILEIPEVTEADRLNGIEEQLLVEVSPDIAWRNRYLGWQKRASPESAAWSKWQSGVKHFDNAYPHLFERKNGIWTYGGMKAAYSTTSWSVFETISEERVVDLQNCSAIT